MTRNRSSSTTTPCACRNSTPVITAVMISTQCICLHVEMACLCRPIDPSNISGTNQKVCPFVDTQEDHSGYATFEAYPVFFPPSSMFIDWPVGQFSGYAVTYAYPLNVAFKSTSLWMEGSLRAGTQGRRRTRIGTSARWEMVGTDPTAWLPARIGTMSRCGK